MINVFFNVKGFLEEMVLVVQAFLDLYRFRVYKLSNDIELVRVGTC